MGQALRGSERLLAASFCRSRDSLKFRIGMERSVNRIAWKLTPVRRVELDRLSYSVERFRHATRAQMHRAQRDPRIVIVGRGFSGPVRRVRGSRYVPLAQLGRGLGHELPRTQLV